MYALYLFGPYVERRSARWRFVVAYLTMAVFSSVVVYCLSRRRHPHVGASGAVFGLFALTLVLQIRRGSTCEVCSSCWRSTRFSACRANISWQGHLGGFLAGVLLGLALAYAPRDRRSAYQLAAFSFTWAAIAFAVAARTTQLG